MVVPAFVQQTVQSSFGILHLRVTRAYLVEPIVYHNPWRGMPHTAVPCDQGCLRKLHLHIIQVTVLQQRKWQQLHTCSCVQRHLSADIVACTGHNANG